jgi:hypothetical protein
VAWSRCCDTRRRKGDPGRAYGPRYGWACYIQALLVSHNKCYFAVMYVTGRKPTMRYEEPIALTVLREGTSHDNASGLDFQLCA